LVSDFSLCLGDLQVALRFAVVGRPLDGGDQGCSDSLGTVPVPPFDGGTTTSDVFQT
jgi:hypothetical protein